VVQHEMPNFVRDCKSLTVWVVKRIYANHRNRALFEQKTRDIVLCRRFAEMNADSCGNRLNVYGRCYDEISFE
jgi:hypothetical protein